MYLGRWKLHKGSFWGKHEIDLKDSRVTLKGANAVFFRKCCRRPVTGLRAADIVWFMSLTDWDSTGIVTNSRGPPVDRIGYWGPPLISDWFRMKLWTVYQAIWCRISHFQTCVTCYRYSWCWRHVLPSCEEIKLPNCLASLEQIVYPCRFLPYAQTTRVWLRSAHIC